MFNDSAHMTVSSQLSQRSTLDAPYRRPSFERIRQEASVKLLTAEEYAS